MKKVAALLLSLVLTVGIFSGCKGKDDSTPNSKQEKPIVSSSSTPEPPPPPYEPNVLTGKEKDSEYPEGQRLLAVMVNNISASRPLRGLSGADILFEIKTEGGITRFMGLFTDYNKITEIGPIRSGRDQFWRFVMPFQPLYLHVGASVVQRQYVKDYEYQDFILDGDRGGKLIYRDQARLNAGMKYEYTAYTSGENIAKYIDQFEIDDKRDYKSSFFEFVNYNDAPRVLPNDGAEIVNIQHSPSYRSYFTYDKSLERYTMSQWNGTKQKVENTVDEVNGVHLSFNNLLVLFTDIHRYPGHDTSDLQYVDYGNGIGYYFNGGKYEEIRWSKGSSPYEVMRITDNGGNEVPVQLNTGRTYVAVVDLDEYEKFSFEAGTTSVDTSGITQEDTSFKESAD